MTKKNGNNNVAVVPDASAITNLLDIGKDKGGRLNRLPSSCRRRKM